MKFLTSVWYLGNFLRRTVVFRPISVLLQILFRVLTGAHLPMSIECGRKLTLAYGASGLVVHERVKIGTNVLLSPGVVIGGRGDFGVPTIGNNVKIMPGAKVLGDITIAEGTFIGVNAVVLESTTPNSQWVSPKARKI